MRIALFTDTYDEINGVGNTYRHLTADCARRGRPLDVYTYSPAGDSVETLGPVRILRFKPTVALRIYTDLFVDLAVVRSRIHEEFARGQYDLVHTATPGSMGLNALLLARRFDVPLVGAYHTSLGEYVGARVEKRLRNCGVPPGPLGAWFERATWAVMRWYYNHCKIVLAPSNYTQSLLEGKFDVPAGLFGRGIDTERFNPRYRTEHEGVVVLYVGRVALEKNLDVLAEILRGKKDAKLVVVGDGPYLREMQQILPDAEFPGFKTGEELSRIYASADVFAFPSTTDTFGNVIREAMSSGVPAVVTDKMGPKEQIQEGMTGFVAHDRREFGEKLQRLISDAALRRTMGQNARAYALTKTWEAVFDDLFAGYARVLRESRGFRG